MEARAPDPSVEELRRRLRRHGFRREEVDELAEEWSDHLDDIRERLLTSGCPADGAEVEARALMGSAEAVADEHARLRRRLSLVGRRPLVMSLVLPFASVLALSAAIIGVSSAVSRLLHGVGLHSALEAFAGFPPLMKWIVPIVCQACGAFLLYSAFSRSLCRPLWGILACTVFALLAGAVHWGLAAAPPGSPPGSPLTLTVGLTITTRPRIGSSADIVRALVPPCIASCLTAVDRIAAARMRGAS